MFFTNNLNRETAVPKREFKHIIDIIKTKISVQQRL